MPCLAVVGVGGVGVVGDVANAGQLRDPLHQGLLDALLEGQVHRGTALAAATEGQHGDVLAGQLDQLDLAAVGRQARVDLAVEDIVDAILQGAVGVDLDRKSTRLNSSHVRISYAVFCLKKKKKKT